MKNRAFTLIELLVVVLIIGILTAIALPQYKKAVMRTKYGTLKNLVASIAQAQQVYYLANNSYANNFADLDISLPGGFDAEHSEPGTYVYDWGSCQTYSNNKSQQALSCELDSIHMRYTINLVTLVRGCWVIGSDKEEDYPLQNAICKAETGLATKSRTGTTVSGEPYVQWNY